MARVGTTNLNLGSWIDEENPGAGSQIQDNTGLNGNWLKLDLAIGVGHNADGTHKNDQIDGAQIKNSAVDGSTLETSAATGTKVLRIKDLGVGTAKLAALSVTTAKIAALAVTASEIPANAVTTTKILDNNVTSAKIPADAINAGHISHDNTMTKILIGFTTVTSGDTYARWHGTVMNPSTGVVLGRAGCIMKITVTDNNGVRCSMGKG